MTIPTRNPATTVACNVSSATFGWGFSQTQKLADSPALRDFEKQRQRAMHNAYDALERVLEDIPPEDRRHVTLPKMKVKQTGKYELTLSWSWFDG